MRRCKGILLLLLSLFLLPCTAVQAREVSVGVQVGMDKYYPGAWTHFDANRRWAQREWAKYANITWTGSTRPNIYFKPANSTRNWGWTTSRGEIYITYNRTVWKTHWTNDATWRSLMMHEMGHRLVTMGHCSNKVPGGYCVMSVSKSPRILIPCATCQRTLRARYGAPKTPPPTAPPTELTLAGTSAVDAFQLSLKKRTCTLNGTNTPIAASIKTIVLDGKGGKDSVMVRECETFDTTSFQGHGLQVTTSNIEEFHAYDGSTATIRDTAGADRLKMRTDYCNMSSGAAYYVRVKDFKTVVGIFSKGGADFARIGSQEVSISPGITIRGVIGDTKVTFSISP